ncbi:hypothetical protein J5X84_17955 [Streptosporangiaceae bacterium NEAU-GS5]|nr:hypothetical protein [Streptosporangiaceae bacterium NEAU-GS5]
MRQARAEDARSEARRLTRELLGEERPTAAGLLGRASGAFGAARAARCAELARLAPLTRRSAELAAIAALAVGTPELDPWWGERRGVGLPSPDEVLDTGRPVAPWDDLTALEMLAAWAADDAADARWGRPVAAVDLNSWQAEDRVDLPEGVRPGDRLVLTFDAGGRLDAVVVARKDDELGSNLDFAAIRYSRPAEAQWSWGVAAGLGPHPLPGERPEPYEESVPDKIVDGLREWALRHGATQAQVGDVWRTKGDMVAAVERVDWMWRSAEWFGWWRAVAAVIDGHPSVSALVEALHEGTDPF